MEPIRTERDLERLRQITAANAVLTAWSGAGLFDALADGEPHSAEAMPGDTRAVEITAPIIAHLGLIMRVKDAWALTGTGRALHEAGGLNLGTAEGALGDLSRLDPVLTEGGPVRDESGQRVTTEGGVRETHPELARAFMDRLYRASGPDAEEVARWVSPRLAPGASVLDVGGGHGRYVGTLMERGLRGTLFDRPVCVEVARSRYGDSLAYHEGDFMTDPLGGPYDAALLSNIIHGLGPEENVKLLSRLRAALNPGGLVVIKDMFIADNWVSPVSGVLFGLTMLLYTREGQTYRVLDFERLCRRAGFEHVEEHHLSDRGHSLLFLR